jgi:hypothetical protein
MAATDNRGSNVWRGYAKTLVSGDPLTQADLYDEGIDYLVDRDRYVATRMRQLYRETLTFTADASTDKLSIADHLLLDGTAVVLENSGGALPAGLSTNTLYYVRDTDSDSGTLKLAASSGGAAINITGAGTGTHTLQIAPRKVARTLSDASQTIQPTNEVLFCAAPAAARTLTPDDANGVEGQEILIVRPSSGANEVLIARQGSGDSMAHLTASKHTSVLLRYISSSFRVVMLGIDATIGIDP